MRKFILALVFVCPPFLKRYLLRWGCGAQIGHHVYIGWFSAVMGKHIAIGNYSEIRPFTLIWCDGDVEIGTYSIISSMVLIYGSANLSLGHHCYIGPQCLINVDEDVRIGNGSALGPRCMVFTHGSFLPYTEGYWVKFAGVSIGDHAWIAAGVFIHPGVNVGSNVFVNSRSLLTQDVLPGEMVEGWPARRVASIEKARRKMTPKRLDAVVQHMLKRFTEVVLCRGMGLEVKSDTINRFSFCYRGQAYLLLCIPSDGPALAPNTLDDNTRHILLVNRPTWSLPASLKNAPIFDLTTMRTHPSHDPIQVSLWRFMRQYFGTTFEYEGESPSGLYRQMAARKEL